MSWAIAGGVFLLLVSVASVTSADPDLWGHVRFGVDMLSGAGLPSADPYSFTQDRPWVNHEWLSELMMGAAWTLLGTAGLALLKAALALAGLWLLWASTAGTDPAVRILIAGAAIVGVAPLLHTLRPQLWTFVSLALLCRALASESPRPRWWLPVLFALWANAHGGWIVGMGVLVSWAAASAWRDGLWLRWAGVCALSIGATLVTPYGPELWVFLAETVRVTRPSIEEWQPLWAFGPARWVPWLATLGAAAWILRRPEADRWPRALAVLVVAYGALRVARIAPLAVEVAVLLFAPVVARRFPARSVDLLASQPKQAVLLAVVLLPACLGVGGLTASRSLTCVAVDRPLLPEAEPVRALASAAEGRLVTFFNWGEYAIWHLGPRLRVSMDGRRETVYSQERLDEHDAILWGREPGFTALSEWRAEYVWLPSSSEGTRQWLIEHGYRVELQTDKSFLAVRGDLPGLGAGMSVPADADRRRCFPD